MKRSKLYKLKAFDELMGKRFFGNVTVDASAVEPDQQHNFQRWLRDCVQARMQSPGLLTVIR